MSIAAALLAASLVVEAASLRQPTDGWIADRGAWGRYTPLTYLDPVNASSELQTGDVLLAVEGVSFEQLEAAAAGLRPQPPANWRLGEAVRYTVLRDGQERQVRVTLVRPPALSLYYPQALIESPILLTFPIFFLIGSMVFLLRPRQRSAQLLFLFCFAFFNDNLLTWTAVPPSVADLFSTVTYWPKIILGNMVWTILIGPLLVHLFLIFPVEKRPIRRFPRLTPLVLYGAFGLTSLLFVGLNIAGREIPGVEFASALIAPCVLLSAGSLIHGLITIKDPIARTQARWVALGGLVGILGPIAVWVAAGGLSASTPFGLGLLFLLLAMVFPISLAIAILRYRLWDIEILINRTLVYAALSGTLALVYFVSVVLLQQIFPAETQVSIVISTLAVAGAFTPLRRRIQAAIDKRFYRRKYDARQTMAAFGASIRDEVELANLREALLRTVDQTMRPEHVSLWLRRVG